MPRAARAGFAVLVTVAVLYHGNRRQWKWCLVRTPSLCAALLASDRQHLVLALCERFTEAEAWKFGASATTVGTLCQTLLLRLAPAVVSRDLTASASRARRQQGWKVRAFAAVLDWVHHNVVSLKPAREALVHALVTGLERGYAGEAVRDQCVQHTCRTP